MNKIIGTLLLFVLLLSACNPSIETELEDKLPSTTNKAFFPDLLKQLDAVNQIVVSRAGSKVFVNLLRNGESWQLESPNSVPANPYLLEEILRVVATAKIVEIKTAKADWYQYLGVRDIQMVSAQGTMIELKSASKSWRVIIGKDSETQKGQYWRQPGQTAVMRVDQQLSLPEDLLSWMDRLIIDVPASGVAAIHITSIAGNSYHLQRQADQQDLTLVTGQLDLDEIRKLQRGLYKLHYDEIRAAGAQLEQESVYQLQYQLFDGSNIVLTCAPDDSGSWCQLRAEAATEGEKGASSEQARIVNLRFSPWNFHLSLRRTELFMQAIKALEETKNED